MSATLVAKTLKRDIKKIWLQFCFVLFFRWRLFLDVSKKSLFYRFCFKKIKRHRRSKSEPVFLTTDAERARTFSPTTKSRNVLLGQ